MTARNNGRPTEPVLYISHKASQCGVYQFGLQTALALQNSTKFDFRYVECADSSDYVQALREHRPVAVVCNSHPLTTPWLKRRLVRSTGLPHVGTIHEITQQAADTADDRTFDILVGPDPTLLIRNPHVFKVGRLVPAYVNSQEPPAVTTIGSFGFGTPGKGFEALVQRVQAEFDHAIIRLHMPHASFADADGAVVRATAARCRQLVTKPGIELRITHDYLTTEALLDFLALNTLNSFFYEQLPGRGISSVIDFALAVHRPIAITRSSMFRHVRNTIPPITVEDTSLREIIGRGFEPLQQYVREWTAQNLAWDYERAVEAAIRKYKRETQRRSFSRSIFDGLEAAPVVGQGASAVADAVHALTVRAAPVTHRAQQRLLSSRKGQQLLRVVRARPALANGLRAIRSRALGGVRPTSNTTAGDWLPPALQEVENSRARAPVAYQPVADVTLFNRILDNAAREQYAPAIAYLFEHVPGLMARKIREANIQQAFVFDTVIRHVAGRPSPSLLCVGSFEDTASAAVMRAGYAVEEIDPAINYDLATYMTKPSCKRGACDVVFATSVIEHVSDDARFLADIDELLAPGGIAVLTCDFNDSYKPGDRLPSADFRFYTQRDFYARMLPAMPHCELLGEPNWDCLSPDFHYEGCRYSFASFVVQRVR